MKKKLNSFLCWVAGHNGRSVGYSTNSGPSRNQIFDLQQCHRCIKCWQVPIDSLSESQYYANSDK